jgi:hypothetical protein
LQQSGDDFKNAIVTCKTRNKGLLMLRKTYLRRMVVLLAVGASGTGQILVSSPVGAAPAANKQKAALLKRKPGYVIGRVVKMSGQPLPNAEIGIYGTTMAGANTRFEAQTDARGLFSQRVPEGIYGVSAYYETKFNGKNYRFTLAPRDGITAKKHDSAPGVVKEFVWKISGLKHGESPGESGTHTEPPKYHGGFVYLTSQEQGFGGDRVYFPNGSTLIISMTPRGKLIDGRTGATKTFRRTFDKDVTNSVAWHLVDLPIGLYSLSARLTLPDGSNKALGVKKSTDFNAAFAPSAAIDFEPTSFGDMQMMQVTVEP